MVRPEVLNLVRVGPLPNSKSSVQTIAEWSDALEKISPPVSDEEAEVMTGLFPKCEDDCFGLAWTLIHLVETSPHWPLQHCLQDSDNPWIVRLCRRFDNLQRKTSVTNLD